MSICRLCGRPLAEHVGPDGACPGPPVLPLAPRGAPSSSSVATVPPAPSVPTPSTRSSVATPAAAPGVTIGRTVHVWFRDASSPGAAYVPRPAIVVHVHPDESINCTVFLDGHQDQRLAGVRPNDVERLVMCLGQVPFSVRPRLGHWTWPERRSA